MLLAGDFFVTPPRTVLDLEAHLQGRKLDEIEAATEQFFGACEVDMLTVTPADFSAAIMSAVPAETSDG